MKTKSTIISFLILLNCTITFAQPGSLDGDFDADGKVFTTITGVKDFARSVIIQPDSKILAAGLSGWDLGEENSNFTTIRYNTDGSLDNSFGDNGIVVTDLGRLDMGSSIALQSDGRIVVGGTSNVLTAINTFAIVRYNQNGTVDDSFKTVNSDGFFMGPLGDCEAIAIQVDGKILAAGIVNNASEDFIVARYNTDGTIDNSFGVDGVVTTDIAGDADGARSIVIQTDGKIIAAGESFNGEDFDFAMVRYNPDGSLDNSFSVNGIVTTAFGTGLDRGRSVVLQPGGKIVFAGYSFNDVTGWYEVAVVRYNADGTLDNSFSSDGKVTTPLDQFFTAGNSVCLQTDGKIIVAGRLGEEFFVLRYELNGALDSTFASDGIAITKLGQNSGALSCAIQPDGRIVAAGSGKLGFGTDFGLARFISGSNLGVISFSKQDHGLLIYPNPLQEITKIEYTLTDDENISIDLYDISGRLIQSIARSERRIKGTHKESLAINASIPSGSYILTLSNGAGKSSIRVVK